MENYNPFESMIFTYDRCFLCGKILTRKNRADEHVYPRWLQREFNLWDEKLILINGTAIPYRNLIIPCCNKCNNDYLNKLVEKPIEEAVKGGYKDFIKLDEKIIFQWLAKLSYGMLFKELSLAIDRENQALGKILETEHLEEFKMLFTFVRTILHNTTFSQIKPWSILIFHIVDEATPQYDAQDLIFTNCFFMRMNDIGIVCNMQDGGYNEKFFEEHMNDFLDIPIIDIQFREICAKFLYKSSLMFKQPYFLIQIPSEEHNRMDIVTVEAGGAVYNEWSQYDYSKVLEKYFKPYKLTFENIYYDDNHVITFLYNEDSTIKRLV